MIKTKSDYKYYLQCDKVALRINYKRPRLFHDNIWLYQIYMRKCAYVQNCKTGFFWRLILKYLKFRYVILGNRLHFTIPFNSCGPGLALVHAGNIIINQNVKMGENCRIQEGVTIGSNASSNEAPQIGNNVYISSGAKIMGNIKIANGVVIGANAVVVKNIEEENITVGGIPAKKISENGSDKFLTKATELVAKSK